MSPKAGMDGSDSETSDGIAGDLDWFQEPSSFSAPESPATFTEYALLNGEILSLRLVGHSPLWGHLLWNAGRIIASYFEENIDIVKNKNVLELGAGAGLPSLVAAYLGARKVVVTDYPDADLIENLRYNVVQNSVHLPNANIVAEGYLWGNDASSLSAHLEHPVRTFDTLVLADILFNHSEHEKLVRTVEMTLSKTATATALVFFTPYRPWLLQKDLNFFQLAQQAGLVVTKLFEHVMESVMFEKDPGDELLRRTVFAYEVRWPQGVEIGE